MTLTPDRPDRSIEGLCDQLDGLCDEYAEAVDDAAEAEIAWKSARAAHIAGARTIKGMSATTAEAAAIRRHSDEYAAHVRAQGRLDALRSVMATHRSRLDALRTLSASIRHQTTSDH